MLLRTVPYHALEFASIKNEAGEWWEGERGRAGFVAAGSGVAGAGGAGGMAGTEGWEEKGDQLATKAVYGLVAKKLLRIKRAGGAASVGFA